MERSQPTMERSQPTMERSQPSPIPPAQKNAGTLALQGLLGLPGVSGAWICLEGEASAPGVYPSSVPPSCTLLSSTVDDPVAAISPRCPRLQHPDLHVIPLATQESVFGNLFLDLVDDPPPNTLEAAGAIAALTAGSLEQGRAGRALGEENGILEQQMEAELRTANLQLEALIESAPIAIVALDQEANVSLWNPAAEELFGWTREEILGRPNPLVPPQELAKYRRHLQAPNGWVTDRSELKRLRKDGKFIHISRSTAPLLDESGEVMGAIGIVEDITRRKKMEAERELLRSAIDQVGEAVVITDVQGWIQYVNPAFEEITGYAPHEVMGENPRILKSGKHGRAFYQKLWQTLLAGESWNGRFVNRRKDGTLYTEDAFISPVRNETGEVVNFVAVKRDITQDLRREEQLNQARKMEAVGNLAGGIAHDRCRGDQAHAQGNDSGNAPPGGGSPHEPPDNLKLRGDSSSGAPQTG